MKKLFTLLFIGVLLAACSKDNDASPTITPLLTALPDAKVEYDNSNFGIYKGVFVGSSGIVKINIKNDGNLSATITIEGNRFNFTANEPVFEDQAITGLTFTNGDKSFDFNCAANGDNVVIDAISFAGHDQASINVMKEYSDTLVKCYQGRYTGTVDQGVFNIMVAGAAVYGLALSDPLDSVLYIAGVTKNMTISGTMENGSFSGSIFGENMSGVWQDNSHNSGAWTAKRTL